MVVEPSRLLLERTATGVMRRTLTKGCFYISWRFAIAAAERIGKDPADPPVGSGARLGRRYTAARLLHVRMVTPQIAVAVVLTSAKSEDNGEEHSVVVTSVLADGPRFDQTLQQTEPKENQKEYDWKIVHEDVCVAGLIANVPVLGMTPVEKGIQLASEAQVAETLPSDLADWYLQSKRAIAVGFSPNPTMLS